MDARHLRARRGTAPDRLLEDHAIRLIRAPVSALNGEIVALLEAVGRRVRADRVALWDPGWGKRRVVLTHEWARPGCAVAVREIPVEELPWLLPELAARRRVVFRSFANLPGEALRERKIFARQGPRSAAIFPVVVGESTAAVLVPGTLRRERAWGPATLELLDRAAVVLANALVRKGLHEASLETDGLLGGVLEAGADGLLLVRPSGRIEFANRRATTIFLRTRDDLCTARIHELLAPAPGGAAREIGTTIDAALAAEAPLQLLARRSNGSTLPVEVTIRELRTPGDTLFCCGIRDVTEDQKAREETYQLRNEMAFIGRTAMLAEMGAGIAHELNQPLTAILSNAETAQRLLRAPGGADRDELAETLQDVVNDTRRAAEVLGRMREMLRHQDVARLPVDVAELLEKVAHRFHEECVARSIRLSVEIVPGLPMVMGDPVQLEQVAMNLVLNAFEAMGEGTSPTRTVALRARPTQPEGVDVSVRDNGPGLSEQALEHAFDAFFTTKRHGLGMGLRISRSIVEAHGGRLLARNNAGPGATFEFHLPAAPPLAAAAGRRKPV